MAIFHASLRVLCRSKGESSVAAAAYRAGVALKDSRLGLTQDYSRRQGVLEVEILAPSDAPEWAHNLHELWQAVEKRETRTNARLARELIVGLPHELSSQDRFALARELAQVLVDRYQVAVQLAVHAPDHAGDRRNHHVHLLFTTRVLTSQGFGGKTRVLDEPKTGPDEVLWLRRKVATLTNQALAAAGSQERVDHRALKAQAAEAEAAGDFVRAAALTRQPTKHQGRAATAASRRGQFVQVVADNRAKRLFHATAFSAFLRKMPRAATSRTAGARSRTTRATRVGSVVAPAALGLSAPPDSGARRRSPYLVGLHATLRNGRRWLALYAQLVKRKAALEAWLAREENRRAWEVFCQTAETYRELRRARARAQVQTRRWRHAAAAVRRVRRSAQLTRGRAFGAQRSAPGSAQHERRAHWRRLREAVAAEKAARSASSAAHLQARQDIARLRKDLAMFEQRLRQRRSGRTARTHAAGVQPTPPMGPPASNQPRSP